jgi:hypothetical protein
MNLFSLFEEFVIKGALDFILSDHSLATVAEVFEEKTEENHNDDGNCKEDCEGAS